MSTNPNQSCYPCQELDGQGNPREAMSYGLTKREYFAAMSMQGMLANPDLATETFKEKLIAAWSVDCADALIAELNKELK